MSAKPDFPLRQLGKDGPMVPAMGFGAMGITFAYGEALPDDEVFAILDRAYELGCTFWDTADLYQGSEAAIGKWFKKTGKRNEIFLASKFGFVPSPTEYRFDTSPEHCKKAFEKSIEALGVDCIDLYYIHILDQVTPIEKTMEALVELQQQGKIKHIGLSNVSARGLRRAAAIAPIAAMQVEYWLLDRSIEGTTGPQKNIMSTCRELGVAMVAATPLGRGMLTSTHAEGQAQHADNDIRSSLMPRFLGDNAKHNADIVKKLAKFADQKGCSLAQLALAWLLKQEDVFVIPGTRRVKYVEENCKAATQFPLTDEEESEIRTFAESVEVAGNAIADGVVSLYYSDSVEL